MNIHTKKQKPIIMKKVNFLITLVVIAVSFFSCQKDEPQALQEVVAPKVRAGVAMNSLHPDSAHFYLNVAVFSSQEPQNVKVVYKVLFYPNPTTPDNSVATAMLTTENFVKLKSYNKGSSYGDFWEIDYDSKMSFQKYPGSYNGIPYTISPDLNKVVFIVVSIEYELNGIKQIVKPITFFGPRSTDDESFWI